MIRKSISGRLMRWTLMAVSILGLAAATGCDDSVAAGDFLTPSVQPMDFSPYGYDYTMYDILTDV